MSAKMEADSVPHGPEFVRDVKKFENDICYSARYDDDFYTYRHVILYASPVHILYVCLCADSGCKRLTDTCRIQTPGAGQVRRQNPIAARGRMALIGNPAVARLGALHDTRTYLRLQVECETD